MAIMRQLEDEEMEEYRKPFQNEGEDRRPTLTFPREIPIEGHPEVRGQGAGEGGRNQRAGVAVGEQTGSGRDRE